MFEVGSISMSIDERGEKMSTDLRDAVRGRYAEAARGLAAGTACGCDCESTGCCGDDAVAPFGKGLYETGDRGDIPDGAVEARLRCGNPGAVADVRERRT